MDVDDALLYRLKYDLGDGTTYDKELYVSKDELDVAGIVADSAPAGAARCEAYVMDFIGRFSIRNEPRVEREALTKPPKESTLRDSPKAKRGA